MPHTKYMYSVLTQSTDATKEWYIADQGTQTQHQVPMQIFEKNLKQLIIELFYQKLIHLYGSRLQANAKNI